MLVFKRIAALLLVFWPSTSVLATQYLLTPDRLFDGINMHENRAVLVKDQKIIAVGKPDDLPVTPETIRISLAGQTLMPGMIEGHSHIFLHPYNETNWNDQVLKEPLALRTSRATVNLRKNLLAGFTMLRDLGTEGAGYADAGVKQAIDEGIIPGPRLLIATRAIVATGSYGPKGYAPEFEVLHGAEPADGHDLIRVVRDQIGHGADVIKIYVDAGWGPNKEYLPTFSAEEIKMVVDTAHSSGRIVAAHAHSEEGMRRAITAGVDTIEHGLQGGSKAVYKLMAKSNVILCPTLAIFERMTEFDGWLKGVDPMPEDIQRQHTGFTLALKNGVTMCSGSDVGGFAHGQNALEPELMVEYGMSPLEVLRAATSVNAKAFRVDTKVGQLKAGLLADIIAVTGNPIDDIRTLSAVNFVMKDGVIYKQDGQSRL